MNLFVFFCLSQVWVFIIALGMKYAPDGKYNAPNMWLFAIISAVGPVMLTPLFINTVLVDMVVISASRTALQQSTQPFLPAINGPDKTIDVAIIWTLMVWGYGIVASGFVARTLRRWWKLQALPLQGTDVLQVFTVENMPPLALSWPRRCVVLPENSQLSAEETDFIIAHERAHLTFFDPEVTLGLLLLQDIFWINPAVKRLVSEWRCAAEIRADRFAIGAASLATRQAYAALLLRAIGKQNGEEARPCPSAYLTSNRVRSVKMRLSKIMTMKSETSKGSGATRRRNLCAWAGTGVLVGIGTLGLSAAASPASTPNVKPLKAVPPVMPKTCPGADINVDNALQRAMPNLDRNVDEASRIKSLEINRDNIGLIHVGHVNVRFNVTKDGHVKNPKILNASETCFVTPTLNALKRWEYPVTQTGYKGVETRMTYNVTIDQDSPKSVWEQLLDFHGGKFPPE